MLVESIQFLSLEDYIESFCHDKKQCIASIRVTGNRVIKVITASKLRSGSKCYTARSANGRQHILFELDFLNDIFILEKTLQGLFRSELFRSRYPSVASKSLYDLTTTCCCKEDRLKKTWMRAMEVNEVIDNGSMVLRKFDSIRSSVELILSLDIESTLTLNAHATTYLF
jgi:hypothetical protein